MIVDGQHGFRTGKDCVNQVFAVRQLVENLEKAYDCVDIKFCGKL